MAAVTLHPWRRGVLLRPARAASRARRGGVALGSIGVAYYVGTRRLHLAEQGLARPMTS